MTTTEPPLDPATAKRKAVRNERVKLLATSINTVGLAFVVTGVVVPLIGLVYGGRLPDGPVGLVIGTWWISVAILIHLAAREVLGYIEA